VILCDLLLSRPRLVPLFFRRLLHLWCCRNAEYLFRGTSKGFAGHDGLRELNRTPTSTDPHVAALFAIESSGHGEGVLHIALRRRFQRRIAPGNNYKNLEREIAVALQPTEFAALADFTLSAQQARRLLSAMGFPLPPIIVGYNNMQRKLEGSLRLNEDQIQQFVQQAIRTAR
jgi:hypothetical protein